MVDDSHAGQPHPRFARWLKIGILVTIVLALNLGGSWIGQQVDVQIFPRHEGVLQGLALTAVLLYLLLMATPFMPGIELALALMLLLGSKGAVLVYFCTLISLSVSFACGRLISPALLQRLLDWLHLWRARDLVRRLEPLGREGRLRLLQDRAPARFAAFLLRHPYLTIAVLLNLPGNALIGGGGGIGLIVGMSRLVPFAGYLLLLALAIAPLPLWFYLQGG